MPPPSAMISGLTLSELEDPVEARLLDVEQLAAQRQDRLEPPVAALLGGAAGRVALDDVELALRRVALLAVGELARAGTCPSSAPLRMTRSRALRAASRARADSEALLDDPPAVGRVLLEVLGDGRRRRAPSTWPATSALPSLAFVWPSNWGSVSLTLTTAVRPSRTSSPERLPSASLRTPGALRPVVERPGQRAPEARDVRAAVDRVDVVREREDVLGVRVVVLERDLDRRRAVPALARRSAGGGASPCSG